MVVPRCTFPMPDGRPCRAAPLHDEPFCFAHSPEKAEEAAEARRLGGLRRRREKTLMGAYAFAGLGSIAAIRRILEIAAVDALGLENSIARVRALVAAALAAAKLLEAGELEDRLTALEAAVRLAPAPPATTSALDDASAFGDVGR